MFPWQAMFPFFSEDFDKIG
uniref:Uncharacterized protein n=1 Tax=Anguilla anguilla TaxID=7936 RepID=A0A0E9TT22_ANGAN